MVLIMDNFTIRCPCCGNCITISDDGITVISDLDNQDMLSVLGYECGENGGERKIDE